MTRSEWVSRAAICPGLPRSFSCSRAFAMMLDRLDADRGSEMRLARAGAANQDDIVRVFQELATMELTCERLVDLATGEVEAGKVAIVGEAGGFELIGC